MIIPLKDTYYHYCELPKSTLDAFMSASSMGQYFNGNIKVPGKTDRITAERIGYLPIEVDEYHICFGSISVWYRLQLHAVTTPLIVGSFR